MDSIQALIEQCKTIKRKLGYTNQFIAEHTGVPEGTVSRVFGTKAYNFKYETIQPIVEFLAGADEDTPAPNNDVIALYADIVASKDADIAALKAEHKAAIDALKAEHQARMQEVKADYQSRIDQLQKTNHRQKFLIIAMITIILILVIIDFSFTDIGWWRGWPS